MIGLDAIVVTGAGRGLGRALALRAGASGAHVLCLSRTDTAHATSEAIRSAGGHADSLAIDLQDVESAERAVREWIDRHPFRRLAIVGAAGILGRPGGIIEGDLTDWSRTFQTNTLGNLAVIRGCLERMLASRFGRIVLLAGGGAAYGYPLFSGYALSKVALVRAVENLDMELRPKGDFLTVCLAPGAMETDMLAAVRRAGAEVRTMVPMEESVEFITRFIQAPACGFSGRFVHVRDAWPEWLRKEELKEPQWRLRRIEP